MRILSLVLFVLAAIAALVALPLAPSPTKGRMRLFSSLFVGAAFVIGSMYDISSGRRLWVRGLIVAVAANVIWSGFKKHRTDPLGQRRLSQTLGYILDGYKYLTKK